MIKQLTYWFVLLLGVSFVSCKQQSDDVHIDPNENIQYDLADVKLWSEIEDRETDVFERYWLKDAKSGVDYSYVAVFYQPYLACNFNPHNEKVYCWIECVGNKRLELSKSRNVWEGDYVVLSADAEFGRHIGGVWYTTSNVAFEGERGDYEFYMRFYLPNSRKYLTTRKITLSTEYNCYLEGEEGLEEYGKYVDIINIESVYEY